MIVCGVEVSGKEGGGGAAEEGRLMRELHLELYWEGKRSRKRDTPVSRNVKPISCHCGR